VRDTVWSIFLTQTPIAVACLWVAFELRGIRVAIERATSLLEQMRQDERKK
jgi:hypothetical protein